MWKHKNRIYRKTIEREEKLMLKGQVFKQQIFESHIFAVFINTFLGGRNGIDNSYKNGMAITYSGSNLTVQSGVVCIQGRFLEEDSSTEITAGTDASYCKLVIEIDLSKQNTESDFVQGAYKVIKSSSTYPTLTQTDIIKNNSGIYQYELARFRTSSSGITDFVDMRTFLNFESIYSEIRKEYKNILTELQQELANVEDGSAYLLKNNIYTISVTLNSNFIQINYPQGFNKDNTAVLYCAWEDDGDWWDSKSAYNESGDICKVAEFHLKEDYIEMQATPKHRYKIILMKCETT